MNSSPRFEEINSQTEFEELLRILDYPFTQGFAYGEWHKRSGRSVRRFVVRDSLDTISIFQAIKYPLPFGKNLLYIPHGPVIHPQAPPNIIAEVTDAIRTLAIRERSIFVRFDPYPPRAIPPVRDVRPVPSTRSSFQQPQTEWLLDIQKSDEELLAAMHEKTRYNIRLAEKKGVEVQIIENDLSNYFDAFYTLLQETATRDRFQLHPKSYYENIFRLSSQYRNALITLTRYQDTTLVANLVILFGKTSYYVFGGSSSEHRNVMAPHLAHWRTIQYLRGHGYTRYNLGGISSEKTPTDTWDGFSTFKRRFGGRVVTYGIPLDMVIQPIWYRVYQTTRRLRKR